eukprot:GHVU01191182.1.p1 GENE.GHVU01191182.1~~GHVU01191182.1.p1  ORF type:complete len:382 (-),score=71.73 GHVU01191182.1:483-1628(-)
MEIAPQHAAFGKVDPLVPPGHEPAPPATESAGGQGAGKLWEQVVDKHVYDAHEMDVSPLLEAESDGPPPGAAEGRSLPITGTRDACVYDGLLQRRECEVLVGEAEKLGYTFWNPRKDASSDFRSALTMEINHQQLADILWRRLKPRLPTLTVDIREEDEERDVKNLRGEWEAVGVHAHLLFIKYFEGGHFAAHSDGATTIDANCRSFHTLVVYLNEVPDTSARPDTREVSVWVCVRVRPSFLSFLFHLSESPKTEGGQTVILNNAQQGVSPVNPSEPSVYSWSPQMELGKVAPGFGRACTFYYEQMHAGAAVRGGGRKYIIRTDILYRRKVPILQGPRDAEAFAMWMAAEKIAEEGDAATATAMFRRCFKMSNELKELYDG